MRKTYDTETIDRFAQFLADGYSVRQAATSLGLSFAYGNALLQRIRKRLGPQAV